VENLYRVGEDMKAKNVIKRLEELSEWFDDPVECKVGVAVQINDLNWTAGYLLRRITKELKKQTTPSVKI